jgi:hypothetical protein
MNRYIPISDYHAGLITTASSAMAALMSATREVLVEIAEDRLPDACVPQQPHLCVSSLFAPFPRDRWEGVNCLLFAIFSLLDNYSFPWI